MPKLWPTLHPHHAQQQHRILDLESRRNIRIRFSLGRIELEKGRRGLDQIENRSSLRTQPKSLY